MANKKKFNFLTKTANNVNLFKNFMINKVITVYNRINLTN